MNQSTGSEPLKPAPSWAIAPFRAFAKEADDLGRIVSLCTGGIELLARVPELVARLEGTEVETDEGEPMVSNATLAKQESAQEFPLIHSWAVISIWALLEALVKSIIAEWLKQNSSAINIPEIAKLKIRLGDYEGTPEEERHLLVADVLEKDLCAGRRPGVARFEAVLEPFGLSGEIPASVRKTIFELGQVRNVIVHRVGVVDRMFRSECPWVNLPVGERLKVSNRMWSRYCNAVHIYVNLIMLRIGERYGNDLSAERLELATRSAELEREHPEEAR